MDDTKVYSSDTEGSLTPEEIIRRYRKKIRKKQGLFILFLLLYMVINIWGIWWADDGLLDVLFRAVLLIAVTFPINVWISWDFMSLNRILDQNCDPVTYVQVMRLLEKRHNRKWNALSIRINEAAGLMWSGQFSEALAQAEALNKSQMSVSHRLSLLNIRFNCYKKLENLEGAMQVKQETEELLATFTKTSLQKAGRELLDVMIASLALWRRDYETFRRMEESRSAGYTAKLQKVVSAACLADVDIAWGEMGNAKTRLEYVIREGGTLYVVEEARRKLAELAEK